MQLVEGDHSIVRMADLAKVAPEVLAAARAAAVRASYEWEWSGLPVATTAQFRFRAVTKAGAGDWSQPTALLVK